MPVEEQLMNHPKSKSNPKQHDQGAHSVLEREQLKFRILKNLKFSQNYPLEKNELVP